MKKAIIVNFLVAAVSVGLTSTYFAFRPPDFWDEKLSLAKFGRDNPTPVYTSRDLHTESFKIQKGDECFYVSEASFSFGEPTPDLLWYKKLIIMCPKKGVGWIQQ